MKPTLTIRNAVIYQGNNLEVLPTLPDNSVDSIVCDPPYELGFMGKSWDSSGIAYSVQLWKECLRVLKPGGHLLAFGGTRTWHRLAVAVEDAGFEIRDNIAWLYGSGFPKSHNISKAIDKAAGEIRERVPFDGGIASGGGNFGGGNSVRVNDGDKQSDVAITDDAKAWDGWGTALKPAHEPIVVARKPLIGTVAENVLTHGVGGINVDACRIGTEGATTRSNQAAFPKNADGTEDRSGSWARTGHKIEAISQGRWPANIILDEYTAELLDQQSGITKSGDIKPHKTQNTSTIFGNGKGFDLDIIGSHKGDSGGASRFFYVAKASKRDRNEGLDKLPTVRASALGYDIGLGAAGEGMFKDRNPQKQNFHPTVKPTALMQYLIRLVTPNNGVVLDPFAGSGSTGKAAILENKHFIGIEVTPEYLPIIEGRLTHAYETLDSKEDLFEQIP